MLGIVVKIPAPNPKDKEFGTKKKNWWEFFLSF
jgi:hypothetical protein